MADDGSEKNNSEAISQRSLVLFLASFCSAIQVSFEKLHPNEIGDLRWMTDSCVQLLSSSEFDLPSDQKPN